MFTSFVRIVRKTYPLAAPSEHRRQLCSLKEAITARQLAREDKEASNIEANLFNQSAFKHQPISAEQVLQQNRKHAPKHASNPAVNQPRAAKPPTARKPSRITQEPENRTVNDKELGLEYIRLGLNDPRLTTLLITARSKKRRDKDRQIIVEGRRLILEALACGLKLNTIIFSQKEPLADMKLELEEALKARKTTIYKVPHHDLKTWSTLSTPPGVMAIFERPPLHNVVERLSAGGSQALPLTVVCDNIREPNNLGSIIRTCAALPCFQIVVTRGCCDPWESKALRGGCGGHFRVPIRDDIDWPDVLLTIPPEHADDCVVFVAENNLKKSAAQANVIDYASIPRTGAHNVVIVGGESHGVSDEAYKFMQTFGANATCLNIPLAEGVDSLNVASALTLILYELRKSLL